MVKEATRSGIILAVATSMTKDHVDVEKDVAKAKAETDPEANLQVQNTVMPLLPKLL